MWYGKRRTEGKGQSEWSEVQNEIGQLEEFKQVSEEVVAEGRTD
jgi:hypothetical protein